ncbi:hypothetical protein [Shewanella fidelis]|uniref:Uncharacterized protein n=1 Tax=Shewanella fidelis TaxID=173509 RepID=A0AAW8NMB9_9GAMM|nr:hypothetical protein [Shewanella fidelis]MDR8523842.1 hypothetical protein [Shewanella fidelis]MDW4810390.1 hypothetical protein [Shewanella fidelis]MDW4823722.1 hypothetical protein [Shewanella fidelis]
MGSKSSSRSSQATENNSISQGVQGDNFGNVINGSGNTITDGGAFDIVGSIVDLFPDLFSKGAGMVQDGLMTVSDGFDTVNDLALSTERQNQAFLDTGLDLFGDAMAGNAAVYQGAADIVSDNSSLLYDGFNDLVKANQNTTDNALNFGLDSLDVVSKSQDSAFDFAENSLSDSFSFVDGSINSVLDANKAAQDGAFSFAENSLSDSFDFGRDSMAVADNTFNSALEFSENIAMQNGDLVGSVIDSVSGTSAAIAEMAADSMTENSVLAGMTIDAVENANANNVALAEKAIDNSQIVNDDAQKNLVSGFEMMMNFAEDFSRSDGADLAKDNSKNMMVIGGVALAAVVSVAVVARR